MNGAGASPQQLKRLEQDDDAFRQLLSPYLFRIPSVVENQFTAMHEHLRTQPTCVAHLSGEKGAVWRERMEEQLFGDVREGVAAVFFHTNQIQSLEEHIRRSIAESPETWFPPGTANRAFSCRPVNFEFQAFHFALRRTLEYVAGVTNKFFKSQGNRIRRLSDAIETCDPTGPRDAVQARLQASNLQSVIGSGQDKSVRDLLAHYYAVDPNLLNVTRNGDGEVIAYFPAAQGSQPGVEKHKDLSEILHEDLAWLLELTFGIFYDLGLLEQPWKRELLAQSH